MRKMVSVYMILTHYIIGKQPHKYIIAAYLAVFLRTGILAFYPGNFLVLKTNQCIVRCLTP